MTQAKPCVVYIAGSGRNGSTFLGLQFERSADVFFAGELTHLWNRGYMNNQLCGCGQPFSECEFWRAVTESAFGKFTQADARRALELRNHVSRFSSLPWLLLGRSGVSADVGRQYAALYQQLVNAIAQVSGCRWVVDSSKYPTDLAVLQKFAQSEWRTVHLIRNCNAVVYSWKRKKRRTEIHWQDQLMPQYGAVQTALGWKLFNSAIRTVASEIPDRYWQLRYEDLVSDFTSKMQQLVQWLGCESGGLVSQDRRTAHSVSGNPCRFDFDPEQIQLDEEWQQKQGAVDRLIVRTLCGRSQRRLGY